MKKIVLAALMVASFAAHADTIHCGGGYSIIRNVTGTMRSSHLSYGLDKGTIQLRRGGKPLFTGKIEDVELFAYNTSGSGVINYEFDINPDTFDMFVIDEAQIGTQEASNDAFRLVTIDGNYTCVMGE